MNIKQVIAATVIASAMLTSVAMADPQETNTVQVSPNVQVTQNFAGGADAPTFQQAYDAAIQDAVRQAVSAGYQSSQCTLYHYSDWVNDPSGIGAGPFSSHVTALITCTKQM